MSSHNRIMKPNRRRKNFDSSKHEAARNSTAPKAWSGSFNRDTTSKGEMSRKNMQEFDDGSFENPKFKEACEQMQENIQKHLGSLALQAIESSESEDELDESTIITKTFENYIVDNVQNLSKTREYLQDALTSGAVACLICIESIKRNDPVWSCENCFCMLHIPCIQKWAKDSMFSLMSLENAEHKEQKWYCPKCRQEYKPQQIPSKYFCFCGKEENPSTDSWTIPHSCGSTCEKKLKPFCGHHCRLLCHPGPCPPCPTMVHISCYCKRSRAVAKRCCNKEWSCGKPCEKLLSCKQHYCQESCHGGDCPPCERRSEQYCICGSEKIARPCSDPVWKCEKICSSLLECQNHNCQIQCHAGTCPPCPKSGSRPCPCGKTYSIVPCTEEILPCGDTCGKLLDCCIHKCARCCHYGDCGECLQMRVMKCRCGLTNRNVRCCKEILCENKCKRKRDCGRHNCNKKCCIGNCPPCSGLCLRTLNCGRHKCQSRCHPGPCFPCREVIEIKCNCEETKTPIPCGMRKHVAPPRCSANCKLPANCHHPERHKHRCHIGPCPPCQKICDKKLSCEHNCPIKCHSAVLTKVDTKKVKEGPWDVGTKLELVDKPCPPCKVPIPLKCLGKHVTHEFPCHEVKPWSCGRACGRQLQCSNHTCELECHIVGNVTDSTQQSDNCEVCERPCEKERPLGCLHECRQLCHPLPCKPCKERIKMKCHCQLNTLYIVCSEWTVLSEEKRDELMSCKNTCPKQLVCGHRCVRDCHKGFCPDRSVCKKKVTVRCKCSRLKKEMPCLSLSENYSLDCDENCSKLLKNMQILEEKKLQKLKEEEEKRRQLELEEFQRKMEGKKKKRRKPKEITEDNCKAFKLKLIAVGLISCIVLGSAIYYTIS